MFKEDDTVNDQMKWRKCTGEDRHSHEPSTFPPRAADFFILLQCFMHVSTMHCLADHVPAASFGVEMIVGSTAMFTSASLV
ncbi:hypothetical protein Q5P01_013130 [Channa striata]|uniref:Uncharacterized protein n=1 Tax=Channa striata TaxID=64152 RepID=A0AA88MM52_CHASR|nr:hypothetical protein Q5P01_013130 [Channa striata]